jgi:hypothetical protein
MSTILKALQKLEQEKQHLRTSGPLPVYSGSRSSTGSFGDLLHSHRFKRGLLALIIFCLSLTTVFFFLQSRDAGVRLRPGQAGLSRKPASSTLISRDKFPKVTRVPAGQARPQAAGSPIPGQARQSTADQRTPVPSPAANTVGVLPKMQPPAVPSPAQAEQAKAGPQPLRPASPPPASPPLRPDTVGEPLVSPRSPHSQDAIPSRGPEKTTASPAASAAATALTRQPPSDPYENTPVLSDGRLKVHAIAWSPTTADRMAVMNSRVVYEGDSVDGFLVVAIRQEDVVVREKEKGLWRVIFGKP